MEDETIENIVRSAFSIEVFGKLVGQEHLFTIGKPLYNFYHNNTYLPSLILFGPPGSGKTTYAKLIAKKKNLNYIYLNASISTFKDIKSSLTDKQTLLLIDEVHRLDQKQQDYLLSFVENNVVLIGTSFHNPYFKLNRALRSRLFVYEFKGLSEKDLSILLDRVCLHGIKIDNDARFIIIKQSNHDARKLMNILLALNLKHITKKDVENLFNIDLSYDNLQDHYDFISAFIKSIRGSDPDAAIYYLARMLESGEDPEFIARRLCILSSEDIGLADKDAVNIAASTLFIVQNIGMPEARINLAFCTIYLALAKKSNSAYIAINKAQADIKNGFLLNVPKHLKTNSKEYLYPHNFKGSFVTQEYLEKKLKYFYKKENDKIEQWIQ
ncbi:replication-associated recombination protein A [Desulfurella sp.]|uniref:replication-associated recombination protein A n=1 Tax=Desulfurella sp. TaxID=1962857 RepID=UPI003D127CAF